ncbi:hypothetical protein [Saccharophagus degradans]|uniref:DUF4124 domain-containing protein n=1 Tax=Saccharophagus degradans TaxID=86304 RepID=A0AAW7X7Q0_9GAMM|nr:hypothetical protein [Saccharophagus degradans]MDO6423595.1 hypothetical protein [Saccharophagus degradans]MDO6607733.1 hypothetical protein [Saccharophagus degradans]
MIKGMFLVVFLCASFATHADIYKCEGAKDGNYYTDTGCINGEIETVVSLPQTNILESATVAGNAQTGYELFLGAERIGHEAEWTLAQSIEHFRWYKNKNNRTKTARGYYNGTAIILRDDPKT